MLGEGVQEGDAGLFFFCVNYDGSHNNHCKSMLRVDMVAVMKARRATEVSVGVVTLLKLRRQFCIAALR